MNTAQIIEQVDAEIAKLKRIKELLSGARASSQHPGRPSSRGYTGRHHSPSARKKIAAAQRARWAKLRRAG